MKSEAFLKLVWIELSYRLQTWDENLQNNSIILTKNSARPFQTWWFKGRFIQAKHIYIQSTNWSMSIPSSLFFLLLILNFNAVKNKDIPLIWYSINKLLKRERDIFLRILSSCTKYLVKIWPCILEPPNWKKWFYSLKNGKQRGFPWSKIKFEENHQIFFFAHIRGFKLTIINQY